MHVWNNILQISTYVTIRTCFLSYQHNQIPAWNISLSVRIFFCHGHSRLTSQQGKGGDNIFVTLYHFHPLTNSQTFIFKLCMWDDYHIFLIAPLVFTRLLLDEIYDLIELIDLIDWWSDFVFRLFTCWFDSRFLLQLFEHGISYCVKSVKIRSFLWSIFSFFGPRIWTIFMQCQTEKEHLN